jgi:hypothetical protein
MVACGSGVPCAVMATPPICASVKTNSCPPASATAFRMVCASRVTSGPMPSPARMAILSFITSLRG